jgi:hypothetical protein
MSSPKTVKRATNPINSHETQLAANVDELGSLERDLAPFEAKRKRAEQLRAAIRAEYANAAAEQPFEARGAKFLVQLGPKANERAIDYVKLWKLAGAAVVRKIATVTLKALEASVSADIVAQVVGAPAPTGTRPLKIFERSAAS